MAIKILKPPKYDTYVVYPLISGSTYGQKELFVGRALNKTYRSYIYFDINEITGYEVFRAELSLYLFFNNYPGTPKNLLVRRVVSNWDERFLTWLNQPLIAPALQTSKIIQAEVNQFLNFDITALCQGWLTGEFSNFGLMLSMEVEGVNNLVGFKSREETNSEYWPKLIVELLKVTGKVCEREFEVSCFSEWQSLPAQEVLALNYTFIIENTGQVAGETVLELSADGLNWSFASEVKPLAPGQIMTLIPEVITRYARVSLRSMDPFIPATFKVFLQGRSF